MTVPEGFEDMSKHEVLSGVLTEECRESPDRWPCCHNSEEL